MQTYKYLRREFLNPAETIQTSYVLAHVEDSFSGESPHGSNVLTISDCKRVTTFDFYLGSQVARDASIAKINLLMEILGEFRDALIQEVFEIAKFEKQGGG